MRTLYLNNSGSRWITVPKEKVIVVFPDKHEEKRIPIYYEAFGNFAVICIKVGGKREKHFCESDGKIYLKGDSK